MLVAGAVILAAVTLTILVRHHVAYFRGLRAPTFGAFLETAGWLILLLVALGALGGGLENPGTARVELASGIIAASCVVAGWRLRRRMGSHGRG